MSKKLTSNKEEDLRWLHDQIVQFLKSQAFKSPLISFIDENCLVFDNEEENKLEYTNVHNKFKDVVEGLLDMYMKDLNVTDEQFFEACQLGTEGVDKQLFDQILAVDDFLSFKKLMVKRNKELEREVIKALKSGSKHASSNIKNESNNIDDKEMKEIEKCIKLSKIESKRKEKETEQEYIKYLEDLEQAQKLSIMENQNAEKECNKNDDSYHENIDKKIVSTQNKENKHKNIEKNQIINSEIKKNDSKLNTPSEKTNLVLENDKEVFISKNNNNFEKLNSINEYENKEKNDACETGIKYESSEKTKNESKVDNNDLKVISPPLNNEQNTHDMACSPIKFDEHTNNELSNKILPPLKSLKKLEPVINRSNYVENDNLYKKAHELISINNEKERESKSKNEQDEEQQIEMKKREIQLKEQRNKLLKMKNEKAEKIAKEAINEKTDKESKKESTDSLIKKARDSIYKDNNETIKKETVLKRKNIFDNIKDVIKDK